MTLGTILILVAAAIAIAMSIAFVIDRVDRWWRFERFIRQVSRPVKLPLKHPPRNCLRPPPDNVMALARKNHRSSE